MYKGRTKGTDVVSGYDSTKTHASVRAQYISILAYDYTEITFLRVQLFWYGRFRTFSAYFNLSLLTFLNISKLL